MKPEIIRESTTLNVTLIPEGYRLSVFAIGGGAAGSSSQGGMRGAFKHIFVDNHANRSSLELIITIGKGGTRNGGSTTISGLPSLFSAPGGSYGSYARGMDQECDGVTCRSVESLPDVCGVHITAGTDGSRDSYYNYRNGLGEGGVIVDGEKPIRQSTIDGEGFGAGGGYESSYHYMRGSGYPGVAVLTLCKSA